MSAMDKVRDEMAAKSGDSLIQRIGEMVSGMLLNGEAIDMEGKSLKGAADAMTAQAKVKAKNGAYYMGDDEAEGIIREYFGLGKRKSAPAKKADTQRTTNGDELDIDALLGI